MAGDWIKMRSDLQTHPKIVRILSITCSDKFRTIGGLHAVWSVFDAHSDDGTLVGYSCQLMDHIIGWDGFANAMKEVGWLIEKDGNLAMPEFDEHNSQSAKHRAEDAKRKRKERKGKASEKCPEESGQSSDKVGLEKEKEKILIPL